MRAGCPRPLALLLSLGVLLGVALSPVSAQDATLSRDAYRAALQDALDALAAPDADATAIAARLSAIGPVQLADGSTVRPDLTAVIADLEQLPPRVDDARGRLTALLDAFDAPSAGAPPGARAALDEVLAREEFGNQAEDEPSLLDRALGWLADRVRDLLNRLPGTGAAGDASGSPFFTLLMAALGIALIVAIALYAWLQLRQQSTKRVSVAPPLIPEPRPTSAAALDEAERQRAAGDYRGALRWRYLATLLRLEEAGRLRLDRSLTNREVLDNPGVRENMRLHAGLAPLVERFDRVWYGGVSCTAGEYATFAGQADQLDAPAREAA